jgi:hypothetical protein
LDREENLTRALIPQYTAGEQLLVSIYTAAMCLKEIHCSLKLKKKCLGFYAKQSPVRGSGNKKGKQPLGVTQDGEQPFLRQDHFVVP